MRLGSPETTKFWLENAGSDQKVAGEDVGLLGGGWHGAGQVRKDEKEERIDEMREERGRGVETRKPVDYFATSIQE